MEKLFNGFWMNFINRFIYFAFTTLSLYTFTQLWALNFSYTMDMVASALAILLVLLMPIYTIVLIKDHTKFSFLYARKILITLSIILSTENPIYVIGVISVCNLTAGILI